MKIYITESQLKMLKEQNWEMPSEGGDDVLDKAKKYLANALKIYGGYYNKIIMVSISDVINERESFSDMLEKLNGVVEAIEATHSHYFDIVNDYDYIDRPDNIRDLDKILSELENLMYDMKYLYDILEELLSSSEKISRMQPPQNTIQIK